MATIDQAEMREIIRQRIKQDYRTQDRFCEYHGIDRGNMSKALSGKLDLSEAMIKPFGYTKKYTPVFESERIK